MDYKKIDNKVVVRIDIGEEIVETLKQLCKNLNIKSGTITGLGATSKATIGLFDIKTKKYHSKEFLEDHEIAPLFGNITTMNNEIYLHIHVNISDIENRSYGGHLNSAVVSATFEAVINIIDAEIDRVFDEKTGLNILNI